MPSARLTSPVQRLLAAVLALCVLLTTLGWAPRACDPRSVATGAGAATTHDAGGASAATPDDGCHDAAPAAETDGGTSGQDRHERPMTAACALGAHCAAAALDAPRVAAASGAIPATPPAALAAVRVPGPTFQPDSPPPKA